MLLLPPLRSGPRDATPLLIAAVLLCVVPVSSSLPAGSECHFCIKEGRQLCRPGSAHCGPCISSLEEDEEGRCVAKRRHRQHGKVTVYTDLDEEIDYLRSIIAKQGVTGTGPPRKSTKHPAAITSQTDVKQSKTDASEHKQKSQSHLSLETLRATTALPSTPTRQPTVTGAGARAGPIAVPAPKNDRFIVILISLFVVVGAVAVILATVFFVKLQKESHLAKKVDYPAFGAAAAANGTSMGDKTLAQNAQMYHYQHQKQQMLSMATNKPEQKVHDTDITSDEEEVGGDFTVYECPGLAPTGEMEVKNPLFDDSTLPYQQNHK